VTITVDLTLLDHVPEIERELCARLLDAEGFSAGAAIFRGAEPSFEFSDVASVGLAQLALTKTGLQIQAYVADALAHGQATRAADLRAAWMALYQMQTAMVIALLPDDESKVAYTNRICELTGSRPFGESDQSKMN